jgi:hypothetical protein
MLLLIHATHLAVRIVTLSGAMENVVLHPYKIKLWSWRFIVNIIEQTDLKFASGNDVDVSRVVLTKEEWDQIKTLIGDSKPQNGDNVPIEELCGESYIPHLGGECPVFFDCIVNVLFRGGDTSIINLEAIHWVWTHSGEEDDIIGYKII